MRPSADYVYAPKGEIIAGPWPLPNEYSGIKNLHGMSHDHLVKLGFYPVKYECPPCAKKDVKFRFLPSEDVWVGYIPTETINKYKDGTRFQIEQILDHVTIGGFVCDTLGRSTVYSAHFSYFLNVVIAGALNLGANIFCWDDITKELALRYHTAEQVRDVLLACMEHMEIIGFPVAANLLNSTQNADGLTELKMINEEIQDFFSIMPFIARFKFNG